jgi:mono/diheme cytochrome c family protein
VGLDESAKEALKMSLGSNRARQPGNRPFYARFLSCGIAGLALLVAWPSLESAQPSPLQVANPSQLAHTASAAFSGAQARQTLNTYCIVCHNQKTLTAGLALDTLDISNPSAEAATWEKVIKKLRTGTMPPGGMPRPDAATYAGVAGWLETSIDKAWEANPNPGRVNTIHRLNRQEYNNAIRDLLALDVDVKPMLPPDPTADGSFDNMANVLTISPAHLDRYMSVARRVTRLAVGLPPLAPVSAEFGIPRDHLQEDLINTDLPLGSRGGIAAHYDFPVDGEYAIKVLLHRSYQDYILGMGWQQPLDIRVDGKLIKRFTIGGGALAYREPALGFAGDGEPGFEGDAQWEKYVLRDGDANIEVRTPVKAGPSIVGVSFPRDVFEPGGLGNPKYGASGEYLYSDEYLGHALVAEVRIIGPYQMSGPAKDTPSRREIFVCQPKTSNDHACATKILSRMARRAYRRPVSDQDVRQLLQFFDLGLKDGKSFDAGIQMALERLLVDPDFLLRVYRDPETSSAPVTQSAGLLFKPAPPGPGASEDARTKAYRLSDLEVASQLSFFLWSSIPDEQLLSLAQAGKLTDPSVLKQQARRMLADRRAADALVNGFVSQWLNLRRLAEYTPSFLNPDMRDGGRELLNSFSKETELFVGSTLREDRSILELLSANYTYLNEKLARHYGIPNVYGSRFRRVTLPNLEERGGLLGEAGILALTSYPDRTSPVLRGKWLLDNILDAPVPPPPSDVNASLKEVDRRTPKTIRERLAQHRTEARCAVCHSVLDPLGFALESFDATGHWRTVDDTGSPVDHSGNWPGGSKLDGFTGLRAMLLEHRDQFAATVTRKLMSYALGRELDYYDQPSVRKIVRNAAANNYRWSSIILGIVESPQFLMRERAAKVAAAARGHG